MTERLYYDDAYLTRFTAKVTACAPYGAGCAVKLDRSAFYPTSGGQPFDTGTIAGANVTDVFIENGDVLHITNVPLVVGESVDCVIDWDRRFTHMQQHAGEHMLANAAYRLLGGHTIGLHLGAEFSTIDVELPNGETHITPEQARLLEMDVNARIWQNLPIRCFFPGADELASLPLRKPPVVNEHVRIVDIGGYEMVACGGTHPKSTGEIGLLKVIDARPAKGKLRIAFICGMRAFIDYARRFDITEAAANELTTSYLNLPNAVISLRDRLKDAEHELCKLKREAILAGVNDMLESATHLQGFELVSREVDADASVLRELAGRLTENGGAIALLAAPAGDAHIFAFARSNDVDVDVGALLRNAAKAAGGKGGGRPDFAQGGGDIGILREATRYVTTNFARHCNVE